MPFGIPEFDEAASMMEGVLQDNGTDLSSVAGQGIQQIGQSLLDSRALLNTIQGRIRSKIGRQAQLSDKQLDDLGNKLDIVLGNAVVQNLTDNPVPHPSIPQGPAAPAIPTARPPGANPPTPTQPIHPPGANPPTFPVLPTPFVPVTGQPGAAFVNGWYCSPQNGVVWCEPGPIGQITPVLVTMYDSPAKELIFGTVNVANIIGPFADKATGQLHCGNNPVNPGTPVPPIVPVVPVNPNPIVPNPLPVDTIPPDCPQAGQVSIPGQDSPPASTVPACTGNIPPIGSAEFCAALPQIKGMLHDLGKSIMDWLLYSIVPNMDATGGNGVVSTVVGSLNPLASSLAPAVLQTLINSGNDYAKQLRQKIDDLQSMFSCVSSCDIDALFAVAVVKTAIRLLRNFRIGTDALLWATLDTTFEIRQIEQLIDYVQSYICPSEIPAIGETMDAFTRGFISLEQYHCWMMMRGADPTTWLPVLRTRRERLLPEEAIQYARRVGATDEQLSDMLLHQGWTTKADQAQKILLYDQLPTIGDHLHWLSRNVFNTEYVQKYQLLDGFADDNTIRNIPGFETYSTLAAQQRGLFWTEFGPDLYAQGMKIDYAARHYAAHWIMPSPEQMKQFVYRLRPDKVGADNAFTTADMERILQEQDYNVLARKWFIDTVNPVPAISYVKRMFQLGAIDTTQLKSYHMDLGYKDTDAANFVIVDTIDKARQLASSGHGWTPQAMSNAYAIGQVTEAEVRAEMDLQGYPKRIQDQLLARATTEFDRAILTRARSRALSQISTTVKSAITAGTMSILDGTAALVNMGWPQEYAQSMATFADVAARSALSKAGVSRIRSAYRGGEVAIDEAANRLIALGIVPARVQQLVTLWQIENTPNRKRRTAQQIVSDVSQGHMSVEEALTRLTNLGYEDADRQLFLADIEGKVAKMAASKNAANIKAGKQQAAELAKLARQAESTRTAALKRLKLLEPVTKLQKWLKLGIIDEVYFDGRMKLYEYSPGEIAAYKAEILPKKG